MLNTTSNDNMANDGEALASNITASTQPTVLVCLAFICSGSDNTVNGVSALTQNTKADNNTAEGFNALAAGPRKVSAQVELNKAAPQAVLNDT